MGNAVTPNGSGISDTERAALTALTEDATELAALADDQAALTALASDATPLAALAGDASELGSVADAGMTGSGEILRATGVRNVNLSTVELAADLALTWYGGSQPTNAIFYKDAAGDHCCLDFSTNGLTLWMHNADDTQWWKRWTAQGTFTGYTNILYDCLCICGTSGLYPNGVPPWQEGQLGHAFIFSDTTSALNSLLRGYKAGNSANSFEALFKFHESVASGAAELAACETDGQAKFNGIRTSYTELATDATKGFLGLPTCYGVPTGVPDANHFGANSVPAVFDIENFDMYIFVPDWDFATGGVVTRSGNKVIHTLTNGQDFVNSGTVTVNYLLVGGGGGGGGTAYGSGGGGGGEVVSGSVELTADTYPAVVGAGGAVDTNGADTTFAGLTALGGGHGGKFNVSGSVGADGGCGGGGACAPLPSSYANGGASTGTGYAGGRGYQGTGVDDYIGGGGGGAGEVGVDADPVAHNPGDGGDGASSSITGSAVTYGGGGGGGGTAYESAGGAGGGGNGAKLTVNSTAGTDGLGGGGGGGTDGRAGAAGGAGTVIVSYDVQGEWMLYPPAA